MRRGTQKPKSDPRAEVSFVRLDPRPMGCVGGEKNGCRNHLQKGESEESKVKIFFCVLQLEKSMSYCTNIKRNWGSIFYFLRGQCSTAETRNGYYSREIEKMGNVTAISAAAGNGCGHLSVSGVLWVIRALKAVKALSEHRLTGLSG